jgi:hypothetical protein
MIAAGIAALGRDGHGVAKFGGIGMMTGRNVYTT